MRELEFAGEARSFIGSAQQRLSARGDYRHAHAAKGAHLAPLMPLTGAAHARNCIRRVREQRRLRGALQARAYMNTSRNRGRLQSLHYMCSYMSEV